MTSGCSCRALCSHISSKLSTIMSANCAADARRTMIAGMSLSSCGYGTLRMRPGGPRVAIHVGMSSWHQSSRYSYPASASRSGVAWLSDIHGPSQPTGRAAPSTAASARRVRDQRRLVGLAQVALPLGVGAAVADDLAAGVPSGAVEQLRAVLRDRAVGEDGDGQRERVEELEQAPRAHAVAVLAPRVVEHVGLARRRELAAEALAERKVLEVEADVDREPAPARPRVARAALVDGGVREAAVASQREARRRGPHDRPRSNLPRYGRLMTKN